MNASSSTHITSENSLYTLCYQKLQQYPAKRYVMGYSGGRDSHVLLHLLSELSTTGKLTTPLLAIHVNHQLQLQSDDWMIHCEHICQQYDIPLIVETLLDKPRLSESIECFARTARYQLVKHHLQVGDIFLSGHHQRDQAETFLLQLMRGAGLDGLRAMPVIKPFGSGQYLRPLLDCDYASIMAYAETKQLNFIHDNSNDNQRFERNYIRHQVLPVLSARFPQAIRSITRSAHWLSEVVEPLPLLHLPITAVANLSSVQQKQKIRTFIKNKIGQSLSRTQTQYLLNHHLTAKADKHPQLSVGNYIIRRFRTELIVTQRLPDIVPKSVFVGEIQAGLEKDFLPFGQLSWISGEGICWHPDSIYSVKLLDRTTRFHPHYRGRSSTVKKVLSECGVAFWLRDLMFGIYAENELLAIPGIGVAQSHYEKSADAQMPMWIIEPKFVRL
ncbi:MAG: tRNA lysidine(34) synthetase TilS [Ostreibacterium sp.]